MAKIDEYYLTDIAERVGGDTSLVLGLENRRRALIRRAVTNKGALAHRPNHGGGLKAFQNAPMTLASKERLVNQLAEDWAKDPFVKKINSVKIDQDNYNKIIITARIELVGYGEATISFKDFNEVE